MKAKDFIKSHPLCCFCGGAEPATTIEHLPARIVFPKKHRPKGLEFPACAACNAQTRGDDAVLAIVARAVGSTRPGTPLLDEETLAKAARGSQITVPGFKLAGRQELRSVNGVIRWVSVFDVNHETVHLCLCRLAAKFALAAIYKLSDSIADESYRINTMWTHNQHGDAGEIASILKIFPNSSSLRQGSWDTAETFYFRHIMEGQTLIVAGVFYEAILLYAHLGPLFETKSWIPMQMTWGPAAQLGVVRKALNV